jgi:transposase
MLNTASVRGPKFDGASGQEWLLTHGHLLKDVQRDAFANFLDIIMLIERQRECLKRTIIFANRSEDFSARITMLKSVLGIDEIRTCIVAAEVVPFERFLNTDALEFWAGMTPDNLIQANSIINNKLTDKGRIKNHRQFALPVR